MIDLQLRYYTSYQWYSYGNISVKGVAYDKNEYLLTGNELASYFEGLQSIEDFKQHLKELNGMFAVTIVNGNTLWASVDRLRTFPLLYYFENNRLLISDDYKYFLSKIPRQLNDDSVFSIRSFGYVMGEDTLIDSVKQIQAGSLLIYENNLLEIEQWHIFQKKEFPYDSRNQWKIALKFQIENLGKRLIKFINNRPVALPLSGGFDSRLIGFLLKTNGYKDVLCFTYGNPDYWEVKRSKEIAKKLGYPWLFIDYKPFLNDDIFHDPEFLIYADYAGNAISFPYLVEYFSARFLKEQQKLPENTLFLPGHSGDMIAGSHLFPDMECFKSPKDVAVKILRKNGKQLYANKKIRNKNISLIEKNIFPEEFNYSYFTHDNWNITQRQSKQIVNSSKVWDFFNYQYYFPLWDNDFADFCLSMPFELRKNKNFYEKVLFDLFAEHDLLSKQEYLLTNNEIQKIMFKYHLKELFPILDSVKQNYDIKQGNNFFYHHLFLESIKDELSYTKYREGSGIMSEWYVEHVKNQIVSE